MISFNLKIVVNIINNQQRGNPQVIFFQCAASGAHEEEKGG